MPRLPPRALHDPVLCLAPTLFRSVTRGGRDQPLEIDYDHGGDRYAFRASALLGCDDLRVLQGAVALAVGTSLYIAPSSSAGALALRQGLHLTGDVEDDDVLLVAASLASLARSAGYGAGRGGAMGRQLRASLSRLAATAVTRVSGRERGGWRLLAWDEGGAGRNGLRIALNPRLGLCAKAQTRFVQVEMGEARRLGGDLARLLHQRLSGWIDVAGGQSRRSERRVRFSTLMHYAWSSEAGSPPTPEAVRQRRAGLHGALAALEGVGWCIRKVAGDPDLLDIARPTTSKTPDATHAYGSVRCGR